MFLKRTNNPHFALQNVLSPFSRKIPNNDQTVKYKYLNSLGIFVVYLTIIGEILEIYAYYKMKCGM